MMLPNDAKGMEITLHYARTRDGKEVDFAIAENGLAAYFIEVKLSEGSTGRNLKYFKARYPGINAVQLVHNLRFDKEINNIQTVRAGEWLSQLSA